MKNWFESSSVRSRALGAAMERRECRRLCVSRALRWDAIALLVSCGGAGLRARRRRTWRSTTDSNHTLPVAPNLLARPFNATELNRAWGGDITYLPTGQGWLDLAALIDLCSRRIIGWAMSDRLDQQLTLTALEMAIGQRQPGPHLIHHSDRGSQYAAHAYRNALTRIGAVQSMSRKGNCWENAVSESFFSHLKAELLADARFPTREQARSEVLRYLVWYNAERLHSTLGYISPSRFEEERLTIPAVA